MKTLEKMFLTGASWDFGLEIIGRSMIMFILILLILRISGKRGVRQLTLFEVAIILGLGSAAGDPMFQEELPILYAIVVLFSVTFLYKIITWLASRFDVMNRILEGQPMIVVREGVFELKHAKDGDFSKMEFFSELRNQSVEHLGQVRMAVLEIDGSLSILFYAEAEVKYGLPLFPDAYKEVNTKNSCSKLSCMYCGFVKYEAYAIDECPRCSHRQWAVAQNNRRI